MDGWIFTFQQQQRHQSGSTTAPSARLARPPTPHCTAHPSACFISLNLIPSSLPNSIAVVTTLLLFGLCFPSVRHRSLHRRRVSCPHHHLDARPLLCGAQHTRPFAHLLCASSLISKHSIRSPLHSAGLEHISFRTSSPASPVSPTLVLRAFPDLLPLPSHPPASLQSCLRLRFNF